MQRRWSLAALCSAAVLALVAACGGGGGSDASPAAGGTSPSATAFSQGTISGFGSVIVNGVRWDDSGASVKVEDDEGGKSSDLKLGMVVQVDGRAVIASSTSTSTGEALAIRASGAVVGPVKDITATGFKVLGQAVDVTSTTVFDSSLTNGLADLKADDVVGVHGLQDVQNNRIVATRVELKTGATEYRLRGLVSALQTGAKTFKIGTETISYATADIPAGFTLAENVQVKVRLAITQKTAGTWDATRVRPLARDLGKDNRPEAEVEGVITVFTSATDFEINGLKVDASQATFPDGKTGVALGARVEVKGAVVNGVLVATKVSLDDEHHGRPAREFELHGTISDLKTADKTFTLRGQTVSYAGTVTYKNGAETDLADQKKVEVKGTLSASGTQIVATRIEFE